MMTIAQRIAALAAGTALLAGCGGGGSAPATPAVSPAVTASAAPNATATGTPIATASITIKYPANFHTASKASATSRTPAYVNPTSNNKIDIFVDGVDVLPGFVVSPTADGSQTISSIPIYSTQAHQIVVIEGNGSGYQSNTILALGETDLPASSFMPGDVVSLGLTMAMNVSAIGITSDPTSGSGAKITSFSNPFTENICSSFPTQGNTLYLFAADPEQGFVGAGGLGAALPTLTGTAQMAGTSPPDFVSSSASGLLSGYLVTYGSYNGGIILNASVANPAYVLANDAVNNGGSLYPGLRALLYSGTSIGPLYNAIYSVYYAGQSINAPVYVSPQNSC